MRDGRVAYVVLDVPKPVASLVSEARRRFSPLRAEYPVEITIAGSSGVGPIDPDQDEGFVFSTLGQIASTTAPIQVRFDRVQRFDGTTLYYLAPEDRRPFDELHERIAHCGIDFGDSPFPFNPHCTISGVELSEAQQSEIESVRVERPFVIERLAVYSEPLPIETHFAAPFTG